MPMKVAWHMYKKKKKTSTEFHISYCFTLPLKVLAKFWALATPYTAPTAEFKSLKTVSIVHTVYESLPLCCQDESLQWINNAAV